MDRQTPREWQDAADHGATGIQTDYPASLLHTCAQRDFTSNRQARGYLPRVQAKLASLRDSHLWKSRTAGFSYSEAGAEPAAGLNRGFSGLSG